MHVDNNKNIVICLYFLPMWLSHATDYYIEPPDWPIGDLGATT